MHPIEVLERHWNYTSFRPLQEDIINSVLANPPNVGMTTNFDHLSCFGSPLGPLFGLLFGPWS